MGTKNAKTEVNRGVEMKIQKQIERCIRKIEAHNERLAEYVEETGYNQLPTIDCTIIGYEDVKPIEWKETSTGIEVDDNGYRIYLEQEQDEDGEYYLSGLEEFLDTLRYDARQLRKAWRVWRAENPDAELERDEED